MALSQKAIPLLYIPHLSISKTASSIHPYLAYYSTTIHISYFSILFIASIIIEVELLTSEDAVFINSMKVSHLTAPFYFLREVKVFLPESLANQR